jgi:flagellar motor switch protein FliM
MAKVLSQAEIDTLLSTASAVRRRPSATAPAGPVIRYNFRRPDRVSKEQIHAIQFLHERFARNLSTSFSAYLRTMVNLSVASVEQFSYGEFLESLSDPTAFYALAIAPSDELAAIEINPSVAFAMIDRMLGGSGGPRTDANRPLTEIEQNVVDSIIKLLLDGLSEAWRPVSNLAFSIRGRETRPAMLQVAAHNEIIVAVVFNVKAGDVAGQINLAMPTSVVELAGTQMARSRQRQRRELTPVERGWLAENLGRIAVPLVPLIKTRLSAGAVLELKAGEVLGLPVPADRPLDVYAGGIRKLTGRLAADQGRLMVLVEDRCATRPIVRAGEV